MRIRRRTVRLMIALGAIILCISFADAGGGLQKKGGFGGHTGTGPLGGGGLIDVPMETARFDSGLGMSRS